MTEIAVSLPAIRRPDLSAKRPGRRYAAERRFRLYGALAISLAIAMLGILLFTIVSKGYTAVLQTQVALDIVLDPTEAGIDPAATGDRAALASADYAKLIKNALYARFPEVTSRQDKRSLYDLVSSGASYEIRDTVLENPALIGTTQRMWLTASDDIDMLNKSYTPRDVPESERRVSDKEIAWFDALASAGFVRKAFNTTFFTAGDSREPEQAGVWGAVVGT